MLKNKGGNMKKELLLLSLIALPAFGQSAKPVKWEMPISTVEEIQVLPDDSKVVLEGTIQNQTGKEMYLFQDSTGTIPIEIEQWKNFNVDSQTPVQLYGEIDRCEEHGDKVEVKLISVLPKEKTATSSAF